MPRIIWYTPMPWSAHRPAPNPSLEKAELFGVRAYRCRRCERMHQRGPLSYRFMHTWQTHRCDCGVLLRVPPVTA
jgi:hypothetical protein